MNEINLSTEQVLCLIMGLIPVIVFLIKKPVPVEVRVTEEQDQEVQHDLRYLQIRTYYGG